MKFNLDDALTTEEIRAEYDHVVFKWKQSKERYEKHRDKWEYFNVAYWLGRKHCLENILQGAKEIVAPPLERK